jgi:hypothetical protein
MAIHLQVFTRTRGGAVDPRKGPVVRKSIFPKSPALAAFRRMTARLSSRYPLTAAGGLRALALLILVQPDRSQQTDAGIRAGAMKDSSAALQWAEAFSEPALRERAIAEISNLRNLTTSLQEVQ